MYSKKFKIIFICTVIIVAMFTLINNDAKSMDKKAEVIIFYSPVCPHCHDALEFLDKISPNYKDLKITKYNTFTKTGINYYQHYTKKLNIDSNGVPIAIFNDKYELGFGNEETTGKKYIEYIEEMLSEDSNTNENKK